MIDVLAIDPTDPQAVAELVDTLRAHCTDEECQQFLLDLYRWDRSIPKEVRPILNCYTRMMRRGAFVPAIVRRYVTVMMPLEVTPEWREVLQWQQFIASLPAEPAIAA